MKSIDLTNNLSCSPLGLGIMRYEHKDLNILNKNIDYSLEHGVNYFEACYFYLNNSCETFLTEALKRYDRKEYKLIDKMPTGELLSNLGPDYIFNQQLKNCQTDYFDGYLLQSLDRMTIDQVENYNLINFLETKKNQGQIKNIGFSFHDTPEYFEYYLKLYNWDYVQLQLNYYDWFLSTGKDLYELAEKYNVNIVAMGPLKGGTLVNNLPIESIKLLNELNYQSTTASWGMRFLMSLPRIKVILTGAEYFPMLKENIDLFEKNLPPLTNEEIQVLKSVIKYYKEKNYISCTGCGYCKCPSLNIDIKKAFFLYNEALKNKNNLNNLLSFLKEEDLKSPLNCIHCHECEKYCPQHLPISNYMYEKIFQLRS